MKILKVSGIVVACCMMMGLVRGAKPAPEKTEKQIKAEKSRIKAQRKAVGPWESKVLIRVASQELSNADGLRLMAYGLVQRTEDLEKEKYQALIHSIQTFVQLLHNYRFLGLISPGLLTEELPVDYDNNFMKMVSELLVCIKDRDIAEGHKVIARLKKSANTCHEKIEELRKNISALGDKSFSEDSLCYHQFIDGERITPAYVLTFLPPQGRFGEDAEGIETAYGKWKDDLANHPVNQKAMLVEVQKQKLEKLEKETASAFETVQDQSEHFFKKSLDNKQNRGILNGVALIMAPVWSTWQDILLRYAKFESPFAVPLSLARQDERQYRTKLFTLIWTVQAIRQALVEVGNVPDEINGLMAPYYQDLIDTMLKLQKEIVARFKKHPVELAQAYRDFLNLSFYCCTIMGMPLPDKDNPATVKKSDSKFNLTGRAKELAEQACTHKNSEIESLKNNSKSFSTYEKTFIEQEKEKLKATPAKAQISKVQSLKFGVIDFEGVMIDAGVILSQTQKEREEKAAAPAKAIVKGGLQFINSELEDGAFPPDEETGETFWQVMRSNKGYKILKFFLIEVNVLYYLIAIPIETVLTLIFSAAGEVLVAGPIAVSHAVLSGVESKAINEFIKDLVLCSFYMVLLDAIKNDKSQNSDFRDFASKILLSRTLALVIKATSRTYDLPQLNETSAARKKLEIIRKQLYEETFKAAKPVAVVPVN